MKKIGHSYRHPSNAGFSALEVILAVVVLVFGLIPMITIFSQISTGVANRQQDIEAGSVGTALLEEVRSRKWDESVSSANEFATTISDLGTDGEMLPGQFDDVDDFNGYSDKVGKFTRQVEVSFCTDTSGDIETTLAKTNIKLIRVSVSWTQGIPRSKTFETIRTNGSGV